MLIVLMVRDVRRRKEEKVKNGQDFIKEELTDYLDSFSTNK